MTAHVIAVADLWRIEAPHFVAGILAHNGLVVDAAPIVKWARGRLLNDVLTYCDRKGWRTMKVERERAV